MKASIWILGFILLISVNKVSAQKNLVANGGFEDDTEGWVNYGGTVTPYDFKEGKNSCAIIAPNTEKWLGLHQVINIPKKAPALEVSAWLKTINVVKGFDDWNGAILNVEFLDGREQKIGESVRVARLVGDQSWQFISKKVTIPSGAVKFKILAAMGYASGTLFIDAVSAKVVAADSVGQ